MKKIFVLILVQLFMSFISGILMTLSNLPEYNGDYSFWEFGLIFFGIQLLIIAILFGVKRFRAYKDFAIVNLVILIIGILSLFLTYLELEDLYDSSYKWGAFLVSFCIFLSNTYFFLFSVKSPTKNNVTEKFDVEKSLENND